MAQRCHGSAGSNFIFSTHEESDDNSFIDCTVDGTFGGGFEMWAPRSKIRNPAIRNSVGSGVFIQPTAIDSVVSDIGVSDFATTPSARGVQGIGVWITGPRCFLAGFRI